MNSETIKNIDDDLQNKKPIFCVRNLNNVYFNPNSTAIRKEWAANNLYAWKKMNFSSHTREMCPIESVNEYENLDEPIYR